MPRIPDSWPFVHTAGDAAASRREPQRYRFVLPDHHFEIHAGRRRFSAFELAVSGDRIEIGVSRRVNANLTPLSVPPGISETVVDRQSLAPPLRRAGTTGRANVCVVTNRWNLVLD